MQQVDIEEQLSSTTENGDISAEVSSRASKPTGIFTYQDDIVTLDEESFDHAAIKKSFLMGMGSLAKETEVVSVQKNISRSITGQARLEAFGVFLQAMTTKCGGNANMKHAWYGASKDEISEIISHGFSRIRKPANGEFHGYGIHLYPAKYSINGALNSEEDENGVRHVLACRVILGKSEVVGPGSNQFHPSSKDYDSGLDNPVEPSRYVVWSSFMNSYIHPVYIISFKAPCLSGQGRPNPLRPTSPWLRFPVLLSKLERFLPPAKMNVIANCHKDFHKKRITRQQLIKKVRELAGDDLLIFVIKHLQKHSS